MQAIWNGQVIAESDATVVVEGNHYFPPGDVDMKFFEPTTHSTHCPWKGDASYFAIVVNGERNENAAWQYKTPKDAAQNILNHFAFWKGVEVR